MPDRPTPDVTSRKRPLQARSNALVAAVLDAAVQVLRREGAGRFTMARVAARAGVSVGSIYQYFPNKAAILFRLQADEWRSTTHLLASLLRDDTQPPLHRLRAAVHAFIRSECDEAQVRVALADAAPLYRDAPETEEARRSGGYVFEALVCEVLPSASPDSRQLATDLIETTLTQVGARFSEMSRSEPEIESYAEAVSTMLCAYLGELQSRTPDFGARLDDHR